MLDSGARPPGERKVHGRRTGHRLRPAQQRVLDELLPELRIDPPASGGTLTPRALFPHRPSEVWLDIGFGAGEHLAWQAETHPGVGVIGAEVFRDGLAKALRRVEDRGLTNVRLFDGDARELLAALPDASLTRVFVLFPDPWPKTRHHKRRFVQAANLDVLARVLGDGGELRLATDDPSYQRWMVVAMQRHPAFAWTARRAADWRERPADWPPTRYEQKALADGRRPMFLRYRRRPRAECLAPNAATA